MRARFRLLFSLLPVALLTACGTGATTSSSEPGADVIQKYSFRIDGNPSTTSVALPLQLTDADWNLKESVCQAGGYDLAPYTGQTLSLTKYSISQLYVVHMLLTSGSGQQQDVINSFPLDLYVFSNGSATACSYIAIREADSTSFLQLLHLGVIDSSLVPVNDIHITGAGS